MQNSEQNFGGMAVIENAMHNGMVFGLCKGILARFKLRVLKRLECKWMYPATHTYCWGGTWGCKKFCWWVVCTLYPATPTFSWPMTPTHACFLCQRRRQQQPWMLSHILVFYLFGISLHCIFGCWVLCSHWLRQSKVFVGAREVELERTPLVREEFAIF